jgi:hypothetical protein
MEATLWTGEPIDTPGLYRGVSMDAYHGQLTTGPSISSSGLRTIFYESAAHYFAGSYLNPNRVEEEPGEALIFGRAAHHLLLGEAEFGRHFVVRPEELNGAPWQGNRKDCKLWLEAMRAERLTVLVGKQIEHIRGMAASLAGHPLIHAGALNGLIEHSLVWQDPETGIWLKARPDAIPTTDLDFSDLKTAADVTDEGIETAIGRDGLNMQGALVAMGCRAVFGRELTSFSLVFVEKTPPYCVRVKTLKPCDLELGEQQVRAALSVFARCIETGRWPGPGGEQTDAEYVELKPFHRTRIEHRLATIQQELAA